MIRPLRVTLGLAVLFALFGLATPAHAGFIDTFDVPTPDRYYQIDLLNGNPYNSPVDLVSPGVNRAISVSVVSPTDPNNNSVSGYIGGGQFSMDTDNSTKATSTIEYTLTGAARDLSTAVALELSFLNLDAGTTATDVPVDIVVNTSTGKLMLSSTISESSGPFTSTYGIGSFAGPGNWSQVNSIQIVLNGGSNPRTAVDFALTEFRVAVVPAPSAVVLAALGLGVLGFRARWNRRTPNPA